MLFKYKGLDKSGKSTKGTINASNIEEAKHKLKAMGIFYKSIKETSQFSFGSVSKKPMPDTLLSSMPKELTSYLNSGMTIQMALKLMEKQHDNEKKYTTFLSSVRTMVDEGKSLYVALSSQKVYALPDFFLQSINVAGQSGKMSEVLGSMSNFFSAQSKIRKEAKSALIYPVFIFVFAMLMTAGLLEFVVPKIIEVFEDTHKELPSITKFVIAASDYLKNHYFGLLIGFIVVLLLLTFLYKKVGAFRYAIDAFLLKMPLVGSIIHNHELGRFSYILSLMLDSGVSYAQAVQMSSTTFGNEALKRTFEQASKKVIEGNKLSNALHALRGPKPNRGFLQSLALGEESSQVSHILMNLSKYYEEENSDKMSVLLKMLEPVMMLLIGVIVGTIVVAMMLPIFTMSAGI